MITPRFKLIQDEESVTATIEAPYVKFSDGEMWMQGNEFSFYCKPYHLKLYFSGEIVEDGSESAKYDVDSRAFTIKIPKLHKGEEFNDLDMLTKLMTAPSTSKLVKAATLIQVLDDGASEELDDYSEDDIDWSVEQVLPDAGSALIDLSAPSYGFNLHAAGVFSKFADVCGELLDIADPDTIPLSERSALQLQQEQQDFNTDHYLADLVDDDIVQEFVTFQTSTEDAYCKILKGEGSADDLVQYSQDELESILRLPKKEYLLDQAQTKASLLGLVDILFAYHYDVRTTMEESTIESSWTIRKLSSTLSWLTSSHEVRAVLISSVRRILCYPLFRHWILAMKVLNDVHITLTLGNKQVLKSLLHVHSLFSNAESYHVLNDLYITDYCVWIQTVPHKTLTSLSQKILDIHLSKEDLALDLTDIEVDFFSETENSVEEVTDSDDVESSSSDSDDVESSSSDSDDVESSSSDGDDDECEQIDVAEVEQQLVNLSLGGKGRVGKQPLIEVLSDDEVHKLSL